MRILTRKKGVLYCLLQPADASRELARQIMRVQFTAFMGRYRNADPKIVKHLQKSDVSDDAHNLDTIDNLINENWYWIVAIARRTVLAFSVFELRQGSVHIVELHTRPDAWRNGYASTLMLLGLTYARRRGLNKATLGVDVANPRDQHPFNWYRSLGFESVGSPGEVQVGAIRLQKFNMEAHIETVCQRLQHG